MPRLTTTTVIGVRVGRTERVIIEAVAADAGMTLSRLLRTIVVPEVRRRFLQIEPATTTETTVAA